MRLAIFTHVLHQAKAGAFSAYAPYIREMNVWLQQVDEVEIVAPAPQPPIGEFSPNDSYRHSHVNFTKVPSFDLLTFTSAIKTVIRIPLIIIKITGAMKRADHLHLRCPGNIGLIACFAQILFPSKPKTAKYAGNWDPNSSQPWSYNLQKWILSNTFLTRNMNVLVYGKWPRQTKNILPFFTATFNETEKEVKVKDFKPPYKFLFVGGLVEGKQPLIAMQLVEALIKRTIPAELHIYGEGPLKKDLEKEALNKDYIHLHGNQELDVLKQAYKGAHFLILASKSEGWPKAVAESMFFGCIPIATAVSCVPWMLGGGSRGVLISDGNVEEENKVDKELPPLRFGQGERRKPAPMVRAGRERSKDVLNVTVDNLIYLIKNPEDMKRMSMEAQEWSQEYTLEKFEEEIRKLLV